MTHETKPCVYIAGKIKKNDFRHAIVPNLRQAEFGTTELELDYFTYVGPFFKSCDHGCYHGPHSHGIAAANCTNDLPGDRRVIFDANNCAIERADIVFAYITSADCYGTIFELGYASKAEKPTVVCFSPEISSAQIRDFWYPSLDAKQTHTNVRSCCLEELLKSSLERFL